MDYWQRQYLDKGLKSQREYPNESLIIFVKKNFKAKNKILELGCGSGSNMWFMCREGMETYGIDISSEGISLCKSKLFKEGYTANLKIGSMEELPYIDNYFEGIVDVVSLQHVKDKKRVFEESYRCLKPGGKLFSYHISGGNITEIFPGIKFYITDLTDDLKLIGFKNIEIEKNTRTYNNQKLKIEYSIITAEK